MKLRIIRLLIKAIWMVRRDEIVLGRIYMAVFNTIHQRHEEMFKEISKEEPQ